MWNLTFERRSSRACVYRKPPSNDVVLDQRGLIYVVDRYVGFDVLEFDGGRVA